MSDTAILIASLTEVPEHFERQLKRRSDEVSWLEVRSDLVGDLDAQWIRERFAGRLLFTYRSRAEGGCGEVSPSARLKRLVTGSQGYDFVDLELERDLSPELLDAIAPRRRVLSWHGEAPTLAALRERLVHSDQHQAAYRKLIALAQSDGEELLPLRLLLQEKRADVLAFSLGEIGLWTRVVAARLGASLVFGSFGERPAAPGQPTIASLRRDFGLPRLSRLSRTYGIVGNPVAHSLSPRIHNGAYRQLDLDYQYLPFCAQRFESFWHNVVGSGFFSEIDAPLTGLSVTAPYKSAALSIATTGSAEAHRSQGANTLIATEDGWTAESTDGDGVVGPLRALGCELEGAPVLVVGCGGAGRAAAAGLAAAGASVALTNRTQASGRQVARELGLDFIPGSDLDLGSYEIVVQATTLGHSETDPRAFDLEALRPTAVVVDLVYGVRPTRLLQAAAERGHQIVDGRSVLLHQALEQFRLMTGKTLPAREAQRDLGLGEECVITLSETDGRESR